MHCNAKSAIASARANQAVAELLARKRTAEDRGRGEWTEDDEAELTARQHDLSVTMCAVATDMILPHLDAYRRPPCPARPPRVEKMIELEPDRDGKVRRLVGDAAVEYRLQLFAKKARIGAKDKRVKKLWTDHVEDVQRAESEGASRVRALLRYLWHAEQAGDEETAGSLRGFLGREWGWSEAAPEDSDADAVELARRRDVISDRLMYGGKPTAERRGGKPTQICAPEVM